MNRTFERCALRARDATVVAMARIRRTADGHTVRDVDSITPVTSSWTEHGPRASTTL